jgi:hypothetical protein
LAIVLLVALLISGCPAKPHLVGQGVSQPSSLNEPLGPPTVFDPSMLDRG